MAGVCDGAAVIRGPPCEEAAVADKFGGCEEEEEDLEWVLGVDGELLVEDGSRNVGVDGCAEEDCDVDGCAEENGDGDGVDARNGMEEEEMSAEAELGHEG